MDKGALTSCVGFRRLLASDRRTKGRMGRTHPWAARMAAVLRRCLSVRDGDLSLGDEADQPKGRPQRRGRRRLSLFRKIYQRTRRANARFHASPGRGAHRDRAARRCRCGVGRGPLAVMECGRSGGEASRRPRRAGDRDRVAARADGGAAVGADARAGSRSCRSLRRGGGFGDP